MKKTIFTVIFSNFLGAGISFLLNIILARLLSVEDFGRLSLIFTLVIICFSIVEFSFSNANVIFYNKFKKIEKNKIDKNLISYLNNMFIKYIIFTSPIIVIILFFLEIHYDLTNLEVLVLSVNYLMFLIFRYILSLHQAIGDWKRYNIFNVLNNLLKSFSILLLLLISYYLLDYSLYSTSLIGYLIFPFLLIITSIFFSKEIIVFRKSIDTYDFNIYKKIILPLGISNIFIIIASRADILIIEHLLGSEKLGIYAVANTLALAFPLITSALRNVFIRETTNGGVDFLNKILYNQIKFLPLVIITYILIFISSHFILTFAFGEKYIDSVDIFNILVIAYIGGIVFTPLESYFYSNHQKTIFILKFLQMIIVVILCYILIPLFELYGAAWSIVISRVFGWIYILALTLKIKER